MVWVYQINKLLFNLSIFSKINLIILHSIFSVTIHASMGKGTLLASVYNTRIQEIKESSGMRVEGRDSEQAALALVRLWRTYNLPLSALFRSGWEILWLRRNKWIIINLYTRKLIIETQVLFWKNDNSFVGRLNVNFKTYLCQHLKCLLFYILNK